MNKMADTHERFLVWKRLRDEHDVNLSEKQLDTVDDIYFESSRHTVFKIGVYRFINFVIGSIFTIVAFGFAMANETCFNQWFFFTMWIVFSIYNLIHCVKNVFDYKLMKTKREKKVWAVKK